MEMDKFNIQILVVDDELDFLDLFEKRFSKRLAKVLCAESGQQALDILENEEVDVVVLDVKMPGMDGITALKKMKKRHPKVEVILLTGHGSVESGVQGMNFGAYDYVMKPFEINDLLAKIQQAYEHKQLHMREE